MKFATPLIRATLNKRYKRFLADVTCDDGTELTVHCANPGSMMGLTEAGSDVWLSDSNNPKRKLRYSWELIAVGDALVGINTAHPNRIVEDAVAAGQVPELRGYGTLRREVKYGKNSRIDLLLQDDDKSDCYVEVKNVTLMRQTGLAEFPDAKTARGTKHLEELALMAEAGHRAVMFYLVQRTDCSSCTVAADIDPAYAAALADAQARGVETLCYDCTISPEAIRLNAALPFHTAPESGLRTG